MTHSRIRSLFTKMMMLPDNEVAQVRLNPDKGLTGLSTPAEKIEIYDPWKNSWNNAEAGESTIALPDFRRSIVIRIGR